MKAVHFFSYNIFYPINNKFKNGQHSRKKPYMFLTFIDSPTQINCYAQDIILYKLVFKILNSS